MLLISNSTLCHTRQLDAIVDIFSTTLAYSFTYCTAVEFVGNFIWIASHNIHPIQPFTSALEASLDDLYTQSSCVAGQRLIWELQPSSIFRISKSNPNLLLPAIFDNSHTGLFSSWAVFAATIGVMRLSTWTVYAALLLADIVSAKAISFSSRTHRRSNDYNDIMGRAVQLEGEIERRSTASLTVASTKSATNVSVAEACSSAVSTMTGVANSAGFAGCYNILAWDPKSSMFQADLRIYQQGPSTGSFANMSISQITVLLTYPESTQFRTLLKRNVENTIKRDDLVQIQQYSLVGSFKLNTSKLNQ